jgi:hypothetical protein
MADDTEDNKTRKTSVGVIPVSKMAKDKEWKQYVEASKQFSEAKSKASETKEAVKGVLRKKSAALSNMAVLDFQQKGDVIQVFEVFKIGGSRRSRRNEIELD